MATMKKVQSISLSQQASDRVREYFEDKLDVSFSSWVESKIMSELNFTEKHLLEEKNKLLKSIDGIDKKILEIKKELEEINDTEFEWISKLVIHNEINHDLKFNFLSIRYNKEFNKNSTILSFERKWYYVKNLLNELKIYSEKDLLTHKLRLHK